MAQLCCYTYIYIDMTNLLKAMQKRLSDLEHQLAVVQSRRQIHPLPGYLRIKKRKDSAEFYHCGVEKGKKPHYLRRSEKETILRLAQQGYDRRLIRSLTRQISALKKCLNTLAQENEYRIYESSQIRRDLVQHKILTDDEYIRQWLALPRQYLDYEPEQKKFPAKNGVMVRSKSEKIIADMLCDYNIPFVYESCRKIVLGNKKQSVYPDFLLLDVNSRREIVFEHFGWMDKPDYLNRTLQKIQGYACSGSVPGINFLSTFESESQPLDVKTLQSMLEVYKRSGVQKS